MEKSKTWVSVSVLQSGQLVPGWVGPKRNRSSAVTFCAMAVRFPARVRDMITKLAIGHGKQVMYKVGRKPRQLRDFGQDSTFYFFHFLFIYFFLGGGGGDMAVC